MNRVFFDTNLFVYLFEDEAELGVAVARILGGMRERGDVLTTSALTLGEVLTRPVREGRSDLVETYQRMLKPPEVQIISFDSACATIYARLRADGVKAPDAIQLACAAAAGCDLFITNDLALTRKAVPGIRFITSLERAPI